MSMRSNISFKDILMKEPDCKSDEPMEEDNTTGNTKGELVLLQKKLFSGSGRCTNKIQKENTERISENLV